MVERQNERQGSIMADPANPLVSIGIPTYNRANSYLKQALRSAVNQTYKNLEIIVSDNCSSDDTESVVKEFRDPRIRYFRQNKNLGAVPNCNFCLEQSQGKYFWRFTMMIWSMRILYQPVCRLCILIPNRASF